MQPSDEISNRKIIIPWISDTFKSENLLKLEFEISGTSEKGDGYVGDITFVKVKAVKENEERKEYDLVLKHGKKDKTLRKTIPLRQAFEREIFVYNTALPAFKQLQEERTAEPIDFMATCFKTLLYDQDEVIVLQNLTALGFKLHNKCKPMNINHIKCVFEAYAKWHALSFAYRDQKLKDFKEKFRNLESVFKMFLNASMKNFFDQTEKCVHEILEENQEFELLSMLKDKFKTGYTPALHKLLNAKESQSVLIHGDCWNNNMMFHYEDSNIDQTNPQKVVLLDFQFADLASPAVDLSYLMYSVSSAKQLEKFEDLLKTYYSTFSKYLRALGSDPEKLFTYSDLLRHWKMYSAYGFIMSSMLPLAFTSKEDVIDIKDMGADHMKDIILSSAKKRNGAQLAARTIAVVKHFFKSNGPTNLNNN